MKIVYEEGDYVGVLLHKGQLAGLLPLIGPTCAEQRHKDQNKYGLKVERITPEEADRVFPINRVSNCKVMGGEGNDGGVGLIFHEAHRYFQHGL